MPNTFAPSLLLVAVVAGAVSAHAADHLKGEPSTFLRSFADSPVDWMPWGDAAMARAKAEQKPVFLFVGSFTSELSGAMRRQTFANAKNAEWLNKQFVCVIVDRDERPDVAALFQAYVIRAETGQRMAPKRMANARIPAFRGSDIPVAVRGLGRPRIPQACEPGRCRLGGEPGRVPEEGFGSRGADGPNREAGSRLEPREDPRASRGGGNRMAGFFRFREGRIRGRAQVAGARADPLHVGPIARRPRGGTRDPEGACNKRRPRSARRGLLQAFFRRRLANPLPAEDARRPGADRSRLSRRRQGS